MVTSLLTNWSVPRTTHLGVLTRLDTKPVSIEQELNQEFSKEKSRRRWYPFQARDTVTVLYPSTFLCFILGLYPCKVNTFNNYVFSKSRYAFTIAAIIVYLSCLLFNFYHVNISNYLQYGSIQGTLRGNFYLILGGVIIVVTFAMSRVRVQLFQNLVELSARLPPETFNSMAKWIHAKDILALLVLIISIIVNVKIRNKYYIVAEIVLFYTTTVVLVMDMLYMNCVCILKVCIARINESLRQLKEILITDEPHLLRRVYHEQRNPLLLIELRALKKQHLLISDAVEVLNMTFGFQLITTVVLSFEEVTFNLYFYILQTYAAEHINLETQTWHTNFLFSVVLYSLKLIAVIWACETGKDQALRIGTNIHEVLIHTSNKQIKDELEIFSLQVLHRENVFAAKGLHMDASLLTKIAGGVTTYLLILIQFLVSYRFCK